jgi:hypothetical protein
MSEERRRSEYEKMTRSQRGLVDWVVGWTKTWVRIALDAYHLKYVVALEARVRSLEAQIASQNGGTDADPHEPHIMTEAEQWECLREIGMVNEDGSLIVADNKQPGGVLPVDG